MYRIFAIYDIIDYLANAEFLNNNEKKIMDLKIIFLLFEEDKVDKYLNN